MKLERFRAWTMMNSMCVRGKGAAVCEMISELPLRYGMNAS